MPLPLFPPLARHPVRPSLRRCHWALLVLLPVVAALPAAVRAQTTPPDLTRISIEDLMNIEITSASRKEQRIKDVASAVFVITQDDIRRSGMTTIPDLLRLAPGVNVAQINANKWAVSVRGFNSLFATKLLVLVDGRSIYNRLYSGVFWDMLDLMVDDVERIEVIRGPGASAWGANAVNGVINIVTKSAADSQRGLVRADAGRSGTQAAVRYGGRAFNTPYRVFAQWTGRDESVLVPGVGANDGSYSVTAGLRADRSTGRGDFTLEGAFVTGRNRPLWLNFNAATAATEPVLNDSSETRGGHVLGRWAHTRDSGVLLQIQSSLDLADRREAVGHFTRHAFDVEAQARGTIDRRHDVVAGVGYRWVGERLDGLNGVSLTPPDEHSTLVTAFVQDDIGLAAGRLHLILGTQAQHDSFSGTGLQPT
ncbi:MAG: TonB-dependent receptor plug domain-containing protein, partial [Acidobacteria bacterium]|nr:TonB-dependent receptor plug domain-containing protein [Acidobacteriota bacterium]